MVSIGFRNSSRLSLVKSAFGIAVADFVVVVVVILDEVTTHVSSSITAGFFPPSFSMKSRFIRS